MHMFHIEKHCNAFATNGFLCSFIHTVWWCGWAFWKRFARCTVLCWKLYECAFFFSVWQQPEKMALLIIIGANGNLSCKFNLSWTNLNVAEGDSRVLANKKWNYLFELCRVFFLSCRSHSVLSNTKFACVQLISDMKCVIFLWFLCLSLKLRRKIISSFISHSNVKQQMNS